MSNVTFFSFDSSHFFNSVMYLHRIPVQFRKREVSRGAWLDDHEVTYTAHMLCMARLGGALLRCIVAWGRRHAPHDWSG